jgi:hypothetical protein
MLRLALPSSQAESDVCSSAVREMAEGPIPQPFKWIFDHVPWWLGLAILFGWVTLWSVMMGR